MVRDLRADPAPLRWARACGPAGVELAPLEGRPDRALAPVLAAAYPPGHIDHVPGEDPLEFLDAILSGRAVGPLLRSSRLALAAGRPVGAILMTAAVSRHPWEGGAFVADLFRDPDPRFKGVGGALLRRAVAAAGADGAPRVGLSVTDGNPVQRLYERLGFAVIDSRRTILAPLREQRHA